MNTIILTDEELDNVIKCIDSSLFEAFDLFDVYLDYLKSGDAVEEIEALKKVVIPDLIHQINDLIVLMSHVDPKFNADQHESSPLYDMNRYLYQIKDKTKTFITFISNSNTEG